MNYNNKDRYRSIFKTIGGNVNDKIEKKTSLVRISFREKKLVDVR